MKKTYLEQMGLEPVEKLNKKICLDRVKLLAKNIKANKYGGSLRRQAVYYKSWYAWLARNGGTRASS